jgi:hypothetical protein
LFNGRAENPIRDIHTNIWKYDSDVKCIHYILEDKPWKVPPNPQAKASDPSNELTNLWWWDRYDGLVMKMLASDMEVEARYLGTLVTSRV